MILPKDELEKRIADSYEVPNNVLKAVPKPMVSVRTSTYQHAPYIKQCIESVLMQKTNFPFELIIGEDFSTDGTREIIFEYARKYPDVIRVVTADYNVGIKANGFRCIRRMRGKYIALCEGDDYWTDPHKLQKQVEFLEKHPGYSFCFHQVKVIYQDDPDKSFTFPDVDDTKWYTTEELLKTNFVPTNSVVYRIRKKDDFPIDIAPGDWYLHLYNAKFGKFKFMKQQMSVYRKHKSGIWWDYDANRDKIWVKYGLAHLRMQHEALRLYSNDTDKVAIVHDNIDRLLETFMAVDQQHGTDLLGQALHMFPEYGKRLLLKKNTCIQERDEKISEMWQVINGQKDIIAAKEKELKAIQASPVWKVATAHQRVKRRAQNSKKRGQNN